MDSESIHTHGLACEYLFDIDNMYHLFESWPKDKRFLRVNSAMSNISMLISNTVNKASVKLLLNDRYTQRARQNHVHAFRTREEEMAEPPSLW